MPRVKPVNIPDGKADEYTEDPNGNIKHIRYGTDREFAATVLPSAIDDPKHGGNVTFDANAMDIPQNIIESDETGMHTVAQLTRAGLKTSTGKLRLDLAMAGKPAKEARVAKRTKPVSKSFQRAGKSPMQPQSFPAAPDVEPEPPKSRDTRQLPAETSLVRVKIAGPFGTITQSFSGIFRDGVCLVLITDHRKQQAGYELPAVSGDPIPLRLSWADMALEALWAGISFTLPDNSVTFTVLLVPEEQDEEGRERSAGPNLV